MTLVTGKRSPSPEDLTAWLDSPDTFLHCATSVDGRPVRLARYQVAHLRDRSKFRIRQKARGVGFSWISAAEALAKAHLRDDYTAIFVSMNLEEAIEKIRYANALYETIPLRWRKRKVIDNRTSLEFEDSSGRHRSRLISHPCKDPRGKHKADVFVFHDAHLPVFPSVPLDLLRHVADSAALVDRADHRDTALHHLAELLLRELLVEQARVEAHGILVAVQQEEGH